MVFEFARRGALVAATIFTLASCGGGGDSGGVVDANPNPTTPGNPDLPSAASTTLIITGIVAKASAFSGATVVASNRTGVLGSAATVGADGGYSVTVPIDAQLPIVLTASKVAATGERETFSTVVADKTNSVANITPITNIIVAMLSSNGNPDQLAAEVVSGAPISQATLDDKTQAVQAALKTVLDALNVGSVDPIKSSITAASEGYSRLLASINAYVYPDATSSTIEISLRSKAATVSAQPISIKFASNQTTLPALPAVAAADFVTKNSLDKINQLMVDAQACYALPLASRVASAPAGATLATGTGANISAPSCRSIFMGNDPTLYRNSGVSVGRNTAGTGAFAAIFDGSLVGVKFFDAQYQYTLANGDIVFSFRSVAPGSTPVASVNTLRLDPADQKLKFIGDQNVYSGRVTAFTQNREFPVLNQAQWNYTSTGYILNIDDVLNPDTSSVFNRVEVVAPDGVTYTLVPNSNSTFLNFVGQGTSNFLRLRSSFSDTTKVRLVSDILPGEKAVSAYAMPEYTDTAIAALPAQSVWAFRFFLSANTSVLPDTVQYFRTSARAPTIAELRTRQFVSVSPAVQADWAAKASSVNGQLSLSVSAPFNVSWTVPSGLAPPVNASLAGIHLPSLTLFSATTFIDTSTLALGAETITSISCRPSAAAMACDNATNGGFRQDSVATGLNLIGVDNSGRNFATFYSFGVLRVTP
jgi:hypothetical protein